MKQTKRAYTTRGEPIDLPIAQASPRTGARVTRWRVEMRDPSSLVVAFDAFDGAMAGYLENQLHNSRRYVPRTIHWPVKVIAYDVDGNVVREEVS